MEKVDTGSAKRATHSLEVSRCFQACNYTCVASRIVLSTSVLQKACRHCARSFGVATWLRSCSWGNSTMFGPLPQFPASM